MKWKIVGVGIVVAVVSSTLWLGLQSKVSATAGNTGSVQSLAQTEDAESPRPCSNVLLTGMGNEVRTVEEVAQDRGFEQVPDFETLRDVLDHDYRLPDTAVSGQPTMILIDRYQDAHHRFRVHIYFGPTSKDLNLDISGYWEVTESEGFADGFIEDNGPGSSDGWHTTTWQKKEINGAEGVGIEFGHAMGQLPRTKKCSDYPYPSSLMWSEGKYSYNMVGPMGDDHSSLDELLAIARSAK